MRSYQWAVSREYQDSHLLGNLMKIPSKALAWVCVALLILYPVSATVVVTYIASDDNYGILAALLAANAGMAFLIWLVFSQAEFIDYTSGALRLLVLIIGAGSGLVSAGYWVVDEVDHFGLRVGIIAPVLVTLLVLRWFVEEAKKEGMKHEGK